MDIRHVLLVVGLGACASAPEHTAPWDHCRFEHNGAASPDDVGARVGAFLDTRSGLDLIAILPGRCELFGLMWELGDAVAASAAVRDVSDAAYIYGPLEALGEDAIGAASKVGSATSAPCPLALRGARCAMVRIEVGAAEVEVRALEVLGRWFLAGPLVVHARASSGPARPRVAAPAPARALERNVCHGG